MKRLHVNEKVKQILEPKKLGIEARLFVTREDGITVYDSVQDTTTSAVAALVSGVWQASEALMKLVKTEQEKDGFRLAFDTSSEGIYLFPLQIQGKNYFLGAIYRDCLNPGQLKRQVALIKNEMDVLFSAEEYQVETKTASAGTRQGYLFSEITDAEIDRLFAVSGN